VYLIFLNLASSIFKNQRKVGREPRNSMIELADDVINRDVESCETTSLAIRQETGYSVGLYRLLTVSTNTQQ